MALGVGGCTSAEPKVPVEREDDGLLRPSEVDVLLIAQSSSPVAGSGTSVTIYDDRWATLVHTGGRLFDEDEDQATDAILQLDGETIARVRALVTDAGFASAAPDYFDEGVFDGGSTIFAGGEPARRITVINRPPNMPAALTELQVLERAIQRRLENEGRDPFATRDLPARARMLLRYDWWNRERGSDRITVFDDGLLEYRRTSPATQPREDADYPTPVAVMRRVDPAELARLRGLVTTRGLVTLPLLGPERHAIGDSHHFRLPGKIVLRHWNDDLEPPLQSILDDVMPLLERMRVLA